jgi:hypothetical protein
MLGLSIQVLPPAGAERDVALGDGTRGLRAKRCVIPAPVLPAVPEGRAVGFYCADEIARGYNASAPTDAQDGEVAYARFPPAEPARDRDGLLPDEVSNRGDFPAGCFDGASQTRCEQRQKRLARGRSVWPGARLLHRERRLAGGAERSCATA